MKMDFKRIVILSAVVAAVAACGRSSKAPDTTGAAASFAPSMTIALSDSLLHAGQTTDTIDMGRIRAGEVRPADPQCGFQAVCHPVGQNQLRLHDRRFRQRAGYAGQRGAVLF